MTKELLQLALDALELQPRVQTIDGHAYSHTVARDVAIHRLKQALAQQEQPEMHDALCPALVGDKCNCSLSPSTVDKAWAQFCGGIGRGPDAPYPGMIAAFEAHYAQSFADKDWRSEAGVWAAAWKAAKAQQEQPASVDAYVGAREDAAIWKKRTLEAEELNRKFIAEVNGPTYFGEPTQPVQEPVVARPIGFDYLDSGQLIATYALPVEGKSHPKLYTHPAPPPPALSDLEIRNLIEKAFTDFAAMKQIPREALETDIAYVPSLGLFLCRAIEAHCRGGANHG